MFLVLALKKACGLSILIRDDIVKFQYSHLSSNQFESLVIHICYELLGMATETFAAGRDGGRDSRFEGVANIYPSQSEPWRGVTIVQAKHTAAYNKKFSDGDFFENVSSEINGEIPKIVRLIKDDRLANYMLFSNRKLPADASASIKYHLAMHTGLSEANIGLVGLEQLENLLKKYSYIPGNVGLNPFDMPLNIEPDELAQIIVALKKNPKVINKADLSKRIIRVDFNRKNEINGLNEKYGETIKKRISEMFQIQDFLSMPENDSLQTLYMEGAEELNAKIAIYRKDNHDFDQVIEKVIDLLIDRDNDLRASKSLTRLMIYYMYYHCDIGEEDVVIAQ